MNALAQNQISSNVKPNLVLRRNNTDISVWSEKLDEIKKLFAPNLSTKEFEFFVELGKQLGANPFLREIWAVKYETNKPAQIFVGRDFYRKKAQSLPQYNGHIVDAVYENDEFFVENGIPKHKYKLTNRGKLVGAYCVVYRKDVEHPYFVFVDFNEYNKRQSTWKQMPATMIKKVAEAQALRGAFQGVFAGTYDESEAWVNEDGNEVIEAKVEEIQEDKENENEIDTENHTENIEEAKIIENNNSLEDIKNTLNSLGMGIEVKDGYAKVIDKVKGASYTNRELLKQMGFKFHSTKKIWYKKL